MDKWLLKRLKLTKIILGADLQDSIFLQSGCRILQTDRDLSESINSEWKWHLCCLLLDIISHNESAGGCDRGVAGPRGAGSSTEGAMPFIFTDDV